MNQHQIKDFLWSVHCQTKESMPRFQESKYPSLLQWVLHSNEGKAIIVEKLPSGVQIAIQSWRESCTVMGFFQDSTGKIQLLAHEFEKELFLSRCENRVRELIAALESAAKHFTEFPAK